MANPETIRAARCPALRPRGTVPLAAPGCCNEPVCKVHSCSGAVQFETCATVVKVPVPTPSHPFEPRQCRSYARGKRSSRGQEPSLRLEADEPAQVMWRRPMGMPPPRVGYYPGTEEAHTNPTRQRGECLRALAGASG